MRPVRALVYKKSENLRACGPVVVQNDQNPRKQQDYPAVYLYQK
jgi:hypothetical protein